jgi:hypothetical protein
MRFELHRLVVELAGEAEPLRRDWSLIWAGWPQANNQRRPDVSLSVQLVEFLPPLPSPEPYFRDGSGILSVYRGREQGYGRSPLPGRGFSHRAIDADPTAAVLRGW